MPLDFISDLRSYHFRIIFAIGNSSKQFLILYIMAKGGLFTGMMRGKLGDAVFYRRGGEQVERIYNGHPKNANTRSQIDQRSQLTNIIRVYQASPVFFKRAFANKRINQTDYNALVSRNLNKTVKIYLPKNVAEEQGGVVAPYIISDGSLTPIVVSGKGVDAVTSLAVGVDFTIGAQTTVGELSAALLNNNTIVQAGDQLSYLSIEQYTGNGVPRLRARLFEMTLDVADATLVLDVMPSQAVNVVDGFLAHGALVYSGAFAWVLSRKTPNGLQVSRQQLICTSDTLYSAYVGTDAATRAQVSYRAVSDAFLDPAGNVSGSAVPSVGASIASLSIAGTQVSTALDSLTISGGSIAAGKLVMEGSGLSEVSQATLKVTYPSDDPLEGGNEVKEVAFAVTASSDVSAANTAAIALAGVTTVSSLQIIINNRVLFSWPVGGGGSGEGQDPDPLP